MKKAFMMSSVNRRHKTSQNQLPGRPDALYRWVLIALLIFQGFLVFSATYRTLIYMSDKLEAGLPSSFWWAAIDIRMSAWLVLVPLLAAIIVDRRSSIWQLALLHMGLVVVSVLVSGHIFHRFAHIQADTRQHLIETQEDSKATTMQSEGNVNANGSTVANYAMKRYEGVTFHKSYGIQYWLGETTLIFSSYLMMSAVGYATLYFRITEYRTRQAERLQSTMIQLQHESLCCPASAGSGIFLRVR